MKSKFESLFVILIMLLSIANIKLCTDAISRLSDNTEKTYITQSDIKSNQYLVTDDYISRISPKTEVESFVMQLGLNDKEIAIYENDNKELQITEGLISTGMIMTVSNEKIETEEVQETEDKNGEVTQEGTDYELSVVGDTNQDGKANIVEVVQIINHLAGFEGKEITGIELISSDVNGDTEVNLIDIDKLIRYIVFEELEIGEVGAPKEPSIEAEGVDNNGWYKEDIKVNIKTEEEEFEKTVYKIDGEKFETTNKTEERIIRQNGIHKIEAYTYGISGNKSIIAKKEIKLDKELPVIESINKSTEEATQMVRIEILANDKLSGLAEKAYSFDGGETWQEENYKEYSQNQVEIKIQVKDRAGNISETNTSIDNIIQEKAKYQITFKNEDGTTLEIKEVEEGILPEYTGEVPQKAGDETFEYEFTGWDKEITAVNGNQEYTATYTKTYKNYTVIFKDEDGTVLSSKEDYHYGDTVVVPQEPTKAEDETYTYKFTGWDKEVTAVNGNQEYVARYTETYKNYTIIFKNEDGSIISSKEDYHYGDTVVVPETPAKEKTGYVYTFAGWGKEVTQVTENVEYIATFNEQLIEYTISYELNGGTLETQNPVSYNVETESFTLNNPIKDYYKFTGWTLNEETEKKETVTIEKGSIGDRKYTANWELTEEVAKIKETDKVYASIELALEEIENGQTIILLKDTTEHVVIDENKTVIIDLNGNTINSDEADETIINKGNLTLIDTSEEKTGEITNTLKQAIVNEENAILNLGNSEDEVGLSPYIKGTEIGIKNEGTLNFFDGKVEGTKAIEGTINEVVQDYNVVINKIEIEEGQARQVATLGLMADSVARIDNLYYISLEEAVNSLVIEDTEETTPALEQTTITMLKDTIVLDKIDIENYMNVLINLNGKVVSSNMNNDYMIKNKGKLEIVDSSTEETGTITTNSNTITIDNEQEAQLLLISGTIENKKEGSSSSYSKTIINNGVLEIKRANIIASSNYSYGIQNNETGQLQVKGGTVTSSKIAILNGAGTVDITDATITGTDCGVYNDTGTVNISGGTITGTNNGIYNVTGILNISGGTVKSTSSSSNCAGIYNYSTGTVTITGGTIIAESNGIINKSTGTVTITGGNITAHYGVINDAGTINIEGGTITSEYRGIVNNNAGIVNISGGEITSNLSYGATISNDGTGTVTMTGGTITANNTGINNGNTGTVTITGGTITSSIGISNGTGTINITGGTITGTWHGIYNNTTGVITLGTNDDIVYPTSYPNENTEEKYPIVTGGTNAIYNNGTFYFYDGIIFTNTTSENCIYGSVTSIEEDYDTLYYDIQADEEQGISEHHYAILGKQQVARILDSNGNVVTDENGVEITYSNLVKAFENCSNGYTVQMISKTHSTQNTIQIPEDKTVIFDLNGCTITTSNGECRINNNGNLELIDTSENKTGEIKDFNDKAIINQGTLTINEGTITTSGKGVYNNANGNVTMNGGTITANSTGIYNDGEATVNVNSGTITAKASGIYNNSTSSVNVEYATINSTGSVISNNNTGTVNVEDGNMTSSGNHALYNNTTGTINVNGGTIKATYYSAYYGTRKDGVYNNAEGEVNITGGTIDATGEGVSNNGTGIANISGGTITGHGGVLNDATGTVNITGGEIKSNGSYSSGVWNGEGIVNITGGIISGVDYGVRNNNEGTINLGTNDKMVYPTSYPNENTEEKYPIIKAGSYHEHYGVYNQGTFNFYDGMIFVGDASENCIYGDINSVANVYNENDEIIGEYDILYNDKENAEGTLEHYVMLGLEAQCRIIDEEGNPIKDEDGNEITYFNIGTAFEECAEGYTVQLLRGINYKGIVEIPQEKTVKLDLNGYSIVSLNTECLINNNGNLEILDTSENKTGGLTTSYSEIIIKNQGDLTISEGTITSNNSKGIYNDANGNVTINGGTITAKSTGVYNNEEGTVNVNSSTIKSDASGIYNRSTGTINVNGGTITSIGSGIYNYGTGTVTINDGSITSSGSHTIYNNSTGQINITGGTITATFYSAYYGSAGNGVYNNSEGEINITGGTIKSNRGSSVYNQGVGIVNIAGGTMTSGVSNKNAGTINITGGTITSSIGISNGTGTINITGGTITGSTYGVYSTGEGTINLGTNDDKTVYPTSYPNQNTEEVYPIVTGGRKGIYSKGTFNFYDGIIFADETSENCIYGTINNVANIYNENEEIIGTYDVSFKDTENEEETIEHYAILTQEAQCRIVDSEGNPVIDENGNEIKYSNLATAIEECSEGNTIQLLRTISYNEKLEIAEGKTVKLDLNGYKITSPSTEHLINNNGSLEILDTSENKTGGIITTYDKSIIINQGVLTLNGVTLTGSGYKYVIENYGEIILNDGNIKGEYGIYDYEDSTTTINGGTINVSRDCIYHNSTGNLTVNGGTIVSTYSKNCQAIQNASTGIVDISGGTIQGYRCGVSNTSTGTVNITGGTIELTGGYGEAVNNGNGVINFYDGEIKSNDKGIQNGTKGTVNMTGGTITTTGIAVSNSGTVNITGGTVESTANYAYTINSSGTVNIEGGKILHKSNTAIYNNGSGIINVGKDDSEDPKDVPEIKSNTNYGIYNNSNAVINFYDGAIIGKEGAVYGKITNLLEGYMINSEIKTIELIEGLQVYTLVKEGTNTSEVSVGGIYYNNLQEAINSCQNSEDVITLQRDINIEGTITIAEGQTITIDLNGFTITGNIENSGTLNITNSKGTVEEGSYGTITGNGTTNV